MQLNRLSLITILALSTHASLHAENYVTVDFLQYNENDNRVAVSAPSVSAAYDIGTDFSVRADFVNDAITGATPVWQSDALTDGGSGASGRVVNNTGDYVYKNQSFNDVRNAWSIGATRRFENRDELNVGINYSRESDYDSKSISLDYMHYTDASHNRSINFGISGAFDEILVKSIANGGKYRDDDDDKSYYKDDDYDSESGASQKETSNTINLQLGVNQILNETSSLKLDAFAVLSAGYLTNPHQRVVRNYNSAFQSLGDESRPDKRTAYGVALKHIVLLGDSVSLNSNYRYYTDDWQINSHTLEENAYYEASKNLTLGAGVRYYTQTAASFYNASKEHFTDEIYASSDQRLSQFNALTYKGSVDYKISDNLSYNLGAEFYEQSTGLKATMITTGAKYHF